MDIHLLRLPEGSQGLMPAQKMPEILRERGERGDVPRAAPPDPSPKPLAPRAGYDTGTYCP